jgi:hypothetical protein
MMRRFLLVPEWSVRRDRRSLRRRCQRRSSAVGSTMTAVGYGDRRATACRRRNRLGGQLDVDLRG